MGAVSQLVVPAGTYTQIPRLYKGKHCNSVCYCNKQGMIDNCVAMPCINKGHCTVLGREIPHQGHYIGNCTICFCYAGELRCARTCPKESFADMELIAGPLCTCSQYYSPVCGLNGKTYTNPCVASLFTVKARQLIASQNNTNLVPAPVSVFIGLADSSRKIRLRHRSSN
ncbi:reversion-inducing cysteine-rich protein with Kazal motifs [Trichonephila clavipes]|nr:reversion-inducing cysteine-rich protein with Kazal motifs [Trichonephila clavipes]